MSTGRGRRREVGLCPTSSEVYCFDTDVASALLRPTPPLDLVNRVSLVPKEEHHTTPITVAELLYGAERASNLKLVARVHERVLRAQVIVPFDAPAAEIYAALRVGLERGGRRLADPDLMIASICLSRDLTLITGNVRRFSRVPGLRVENWL